MLYFFTFCKTVTVLLSHLDKKWLFAGWLAAQIVGILYCLQPRWMPWAVCLRRHDWDRDLQDGKSLPPLITSSAMLMANKLSQRVVVDIAR